MNKEALKAVENFTDAELDAYFQGFCGANGHYPDAEEIEAARSLTKVALAMYKASK